MRKGERTRERILARAAILFNRQGYAGSSLADLMAVTGLEKGGIYNHFGSKEALALEAFEYAVGLVRRRFTRALEGKAGALERLLAIVSVFRQYADDPPVAGGCPVLNTAVESDDTHPALRERARRAVDEWRGLIVDAVRDGQASGEVTAGVDAESLASFMISTLEGAVMLARLYGDGGHLRRAVEHLTEHVERVVAH